jgi:hypothetical protein
MCWVIAACQSAPKVKSLGVRWTTTARLLLRPTGSLHHWTDTRLQATAGSKWFETKLALRICFTAYYLYWFVSVPSESGKIGDAFLDLRYAWAPLHCEKANVTGLGDSWRFQIYVTAVQSEIIRTCYMCRIRDAYWSRTLESWIIRWEPIVNASLKIMKGHEFFNIRDRKTLHRDWSAICSRLRRTIWESIIARGDINMILHDTSASVKSYQLVKVVLGGRAPGKSSSLASPQLNLQI